MQTYDLLMICRSAAIDEARSQGDGLPPKLVEASKGIRTGDGVRSEYLRELDGTASGEGWVYGL